MRSIPTRRATCSGRSASAKEAPWAGCNGAQPPTRTNIYVAVSDIKRIMLNYSTSTDADPSQGGGMFALRLDNGERMWYHDPISCGERKRCSPAQSAAVTAIPGAAFSGSMDGHLRAYSSTDGKILWDYDTIREYKT